MPSKQSLALILFGAVLVFLCGAVRADDRQDIEYAQKLYNLRADQVFNNLRDNPDNATVQYVLDELVKSFCGGASSKHKAPTWKLPGNAKWSDFNVTWGANDAPFVFGIDGIRGVYEFLGKNIFNKDSLHNVNVINVKMLSGTEAILTANIQTWLNLRIFDSAPSFSLARGYYSNKFSKVNGNWCISEFEAYTLHQGPLDYNVTINYDFPFALLARGF